MVQFGNVQGGIGSSGLSLEDPRKKEDPDFNPPSLASLKQAQRLKEMQEFKFQSPFPPPGERQYTAPPVLPGLEAAAPMPDMSPQPGGDATGAMPPIEPPGARLPMPTYQEPERPGKMRTALGIGLSGMANLSGQGPQAAANFFLAPEARAERDYARELGAYSARQGEWSQYYEDIMGQQEHELNVQKLEEVKGRPVGFSRGGGYGTREGELLLRDEGGMFPGMGSAWEAEKIQAYRVWLEKPQNAGKTLATMTATDRQSAERDLNRFFGREVMTPRWDPDQPGVVVPGYRSEAEGRPMPITVYGPEGPQTGGEPGFRRTPPPAARPRGFSDTQRANFEIEYETERTEAAFFDEASKEAVENKYDAIFVRGSAHNEGDELTLERAQDYIRIARAELGPEALNTSVDRLAEAWAKADGYTIPIIYD